MICKIAWDFEVFDGIASLLKISGYTVSYSLELMFCRLLYFLTKPIFKIQISWIGSLSWDTSCHLVGEYYHTHCIICKTKTRRYITQMLAKSAIKYSSMNLQIFKDEVCGCSKATESMKFYLLKVLDYIVYM